MKNERVKIRRIESYHNTLMQVFSSSFYPAKLHAQENISRQDHLREITKKLLELTGCEMIDLCYREKDRYYYSRTDVYKKPSFKFSSKQFTSGTKNIYFYSEVNGLNEWLIRNFMINKKHSGSGKFTRHNGYINSNIHGLFENYQHESRNDIFKNKIFYNSLAIFPIGDSNKKTGFIILWSKQKDYFNEKVIKFYEDVSYITGFALDYAISQFSLHERVKELSCLYEISKTSANREISLDSILTEIVKLIPTAWQFNEIAEARIIFDKKSYSTLNFRKTSQVQSSDIIVKGKNRGTIEVVYLKKVQANDIGPFLFEERDLIDSIARKIGLIIEYKLAELDKTNLEDQLRHTERLATLGQLVASIVHEINEPITNILGYAQLINKDSLLPRQSEKDIAKIINSTLYIREIIKQLLTFAKEVHSAKIPLNFNKIIKNSIPFLESRCVKENIKISTSLFPDLPDILADPVQMTQILMNIAINAIQAMPKGGRLDINTAFLENKVQLVIEDNGIGMTEDVKKQIFLPFFTTKKTGEGTGLGLSVVYGIILAHKGSINVYTNLGKGTRFEICIPVINLSK